MCNFRTAGLLCLGAAGAAFAQGPVVLQRGVLNAVTLEPAPSRVAPGDILTLRGLNLGPAEEVKATVTPLPTTLADVRVLIGTRAAPIFSVSAAQIRVQVPQQTPTGLINVVVQRGEVRSRPVIVRVQATAIAAITNNGLGFGEAGMVIGKKIKLSATGLGPSEPPVPAGQPGAEDGSSVPRRPIRAHIGGLPAEVKASLSPARVGEFDVTVDIPEGAQPGDLVTLSSGAAPITRTVYGLASSPVVQYVRLPNGLRNLRAFRQSDLRGSYLIANGPRGDDGCFPSWVFDMARATSSPVGPCLVAQANAASPVNPINESGVFASFAGPSSDQPNMISSKVVLFNPTKSGPMQVELPGPANVLASLAGGSVAAIGGEKPYSIDAETGDVSELTAATLGAGGGGAAAGAVPGGAAGRILALEVDLGEGITSILSNPIGAGQGVNLIVVGNDAAKPTRAKLALLGADLAVTATRDFPQSWLPLIPPIAPVQGGGGAGAGAGPPNAVQARRLPTYFDAASRAFFVLARKADGSAQGFVSFSGEDLTPKAVPFPEGWFAATCAPNLPVFNLELSRRLALFGTRRAQEAVLAACPAQGYLALEFATQTISAVPLPGVGEANTRAASGEVNDYLYASNTDSQNAALSDTLYIYDSVAGSPFRLDLPAGIVGFQQIVPVPALNGLVATAIATRIAGDGGLIFFDLENEKTTVFPVPDGFTTVNYIGVITDTRKLIARGVKADGTQYLIYDLITGDLMMPPNPEGVSFVGPLPAVAAQPGAGGGGGGAGGGVPPGQGNAGGGAAQQQVQAQLINAKSNTITALAYDAVRTLVGLVTIKVP